jgi:hypothetical protein
MNEFLSTTKKEYCTLQQNLLDRLPDASKASTTSNKFKTSHKKTKSYQTNYQPIEWQLYTCSATTSHKTLKILK